jgi:hypothetical protein
MIRRLTGTVLVALVSAIAGLHGAQAAGLPSLYVDYREDCTFRVTNDAGATVTQVAPTTYQVVVATPAPFAGIFTPGANDLIGCKGNVSFRLTGPGVNVFTTLDGGDGAYEVYGVTFQTGASYTMQDDTNVSGTRRTLVAVPSTPVASGPSTSTPSSSGTKKNTPAVEHVDTTLRGSLAGSVTTTGKLALTLRGKPVSTLKSGRYRITVLDETSRTAFKLQRAGKPAMTVTTTGYVGRRTVTVSLQRGQWTFFSTPGKKISFMVTA